jgi:hypothetical protein
MTGLATSYDLDAPLRLARLRRDGGANLIKKVETWALSVRGALAAMTDS